MAGMGPVDAAPLWLGDRQVWPPVVLAPMAGITNVAFRQLCREYGAGLYVSEMVTSRALVERDRETMRMVAFCPQESPRSLQLYGVDPTVVGQAVRMVVAEGLADHVDLNFGCPVPKVTRKGGGSALPYKRRLFGAILSAAVRAADGQVPVTVKMRKGIDEGHLTYLDAGRIAQDAGVAWVALHARTASQMYSGHADWDAIGELKAALDVPVLGNGDLWEATDALAMRAATGCDGVVVGRGCLGRPWLFGDLAAAFDGRPGDVARPDLAQVVTVMRRHAGLLAAAMGDEGRGCRDFRKHVAWYLKGFRVGSASRQALGLVGSLVELDALLAGLELDQPFPAAVLGSPRGRTTAVRAVSLPDRWLDDPEADLVPSGAELAHSGG
jgi:nifR3 family TIM-barrel protein